MALLYCSLITLGAAVGSGIAYLVQRKKRRSTRMQYKFDPYKTAPIPPNVFVASGSYDDKLLNQLPNGHVSLSLELLTKECLERLCERIQTDRDVNVRVKVGEDYYWRAATTEDLYAMIELGRLEFPYWIWWQWEGGLHAHKELRHSSRTLYKFVSEDYCPPPQEFVVLGATDDDYQFDRAPYDYESLSLELLAEEGSKRLRERIQTGREIDVMVKVGEDYYWRIATTEDLDAMIDLAWLELPKPTWWAAARST